MADAKSRYEIVEGLTEQKQKIIDERANLDADILARTDNIAQQERNFKREMAQNALSYERNVEENTRNHTNNIEDMEARLETYKGSVVERKVGLDAKEKALTEAIDAIKAISANNEKA
jgi:hypothetical protein